MATYLWNDIEYKSYNPTEWDADKRNGYVIFRKIYVQALDEVSFLVAVNMCGYVFTINMFLVCPRSHVNLIT